MTDWFSRVPLDTDDNLGYRNDILKKCEFSKKFRDMALSACKDDVLWFFSTFCWVYEPRPKIRDGVKYSKRVPFIPWPHQVDAIRKINEHLGHEDIGVEKSRGEGMSWIAVLFACNSFVNDEDAKVGLVSRTELAADNPDDSDSLGWKIDYELDCLPEWMVGIKGRDWTRNRNNHTWAHKWTGSSIAAGAATGNIFRGGRLTYAVMDEFAFFNKGEDTEALNSSHGSTNCRVFVSTVNGCHNEYYNVMHEPSAMVPVVIDWKQNVTRNRGLYVMKRGKPVAVDPVNNPLPSHYNPPTKEVLDLFSRLRSRGFNLEKNKDGERIQRSPWYDHECDRAGMTPQSIAQELDRDYGGSSFLVFGNEFIKAVHQSIAVPTHTGNFSVTSHVEDGEMVMKAEFQEIRSGPVDLWVPLNVQGRPPKGMYALSADISSGLGGSHTSNSTLYGSDLSTHEQILGYAANTIEPSEFADLSVAAALWLYGAYLGWESNGQQGGAFTKRIKDLKYPNCYRRHSFKKKKRTVTTDLGFHTDDYSKGIMFSEMTRAVRASEAIVKCKKLALEFRQYVMINGKIEHAQSLTTKDDSSKGKAHGDRVIAFGVNCQQLLDRPSEYVGVIMDEQGKAMVKSQSISGTMAERVDMYRQEDRAAELNKRRDRWVGSVLKRRR